METTMLKYIKKIEINKKYISQAFSSIDPNLDCNEKMKQIYIVSKELVPQFYTGKTFCNSYRYLQRGISACEQKLPSKFILQSNPIFIKPTNEESDENILSNIVYETRKYLIKYHNEFSNYININLLELTNDCAIASNFVHKTCQSKGIKSYIISLFPGFSKEENLYDGSGFHFFNIIYLNNKYYIIDCTYRQFFILKGSELERIGIPYFPGCKPGIFMLMTESRKKVAEKILKDGWIEVTDSTLKDYLDGFALSYRNGLFYDQTNDYSFTTPYSSTDYRNFLLGLDTQISHESKEVLGYQKTPTKKTTLFSKSQTK